MPDEDDEREDQIRWFESLKEMHEAGQHEDVAKAIEGAIKVLRRKGEVENSS